MSRTRFTPIPFGTEGKLCLLEDGGVSLRCRESGRLDWDADFRAIQEILALTPIDVVADVGAYIGDSTECFLRQRADVFAFEPHEEAYLCLVHNCPDAQCFPFALGNGERYDVSTRGGNMSAEPLLSNPTCTRESVKLDSMRFPKLTYLKIDVEGFEPRVLAGAEETIRRCHPILHIEVNPGALSLFGATAATLLSQITALGYRDIREVFRYYDQNWDLLCKFSPP